MIFRNRSLARLGAAALLASGVFTAMGTPAHATSTETDLALQAVVGMKTTANVEGKFGWVKISNKGTGTPTELVVKADVSKVDFDKALIMPFTGDCTLEGDDRPELVTCKVAKEDIPGPGETAEVLVFVVKNPDAVKEAYSAPVTFSIESPDDTDKSNNSAKANVEITTDSGVDLGVVVEDVKTRFDLDAGAEQPAAPVRPGDTAVVLGEVINQGDMIGQGIRLTFQLPKGVTFALPMEACTVSADKRSAVCEDKAFQFEPRMGMFLEMPVVVDKGVKAPSTLPGGSLEAEALGSLPVDSPLARKTSRTTIGKAVVVGADDPRFADLDPTDNKDDYAVVVAAGTGGEGGGGDDDGGLPVTGAQTTLIGGIGGAVLVAGAVMFMVARRRRVVLVTPGDERPTA
ncbi:LPXTG cell wall anchor domain-containing protein [Micromonospora peucetia]|uniref:LPXTG cell wall anchor domain-containing protein n=1 Tax=Micromonospora peucetia TaxID=47871 RepID=UPI0022511F7D|nr:LPXTG cell wall anchor domain-containing protein [Micromonospora peucetia]MCX4387200.1 LPXTG cell wall anchor domain-containing protein [Micromonospora peucetia]